MSVTLDPIQTIRKEGKHFEGLSRQKSLGPENIHQLWCPSLRVLAETNQLPDEEILTGWIAGVVKEIGRNRYVTVCRSKNMRAYPLLRYYKVDLNKSTNEQDSLSFIVDQPGQSGCIPQTGANIEGKISPNFEDGECRGITGNGVIRVTPLGKKGIAIMHTMNQICPLKTVKGGQFQRFLAAPNILMSLRRTAITLRSLAAADPKTLDRGHQALEAEFFRQLPKLAGIAADHLESVRSNERDLNRLMRVFAQNLPILRLGGMDIRVVHDRVNGPDPRTWVTSIHTRNKDASEQENQQGFHQAWQSLIS